MVALSRNCPLKSRNAIQSLLCQNKSETSQKAVVGEYKLFQKKCYVPKFYFQII